MSIAENLARVRERIAEAERKAGRKAGSVSLMAVSKFHPAESVLEAMAAGQNLFGENRVQEATEKFAEVAARRSGAELHLIGSLQRNKVSKIITVASCIQSVDRGELLAEIEKQAAARERSIRVLFEYHTGEESKSGYPDQDTLFRSIDLLAGMPHVQCAGLMTMAPFTADRDVVRASFTTLKSLQSECQRRYPSLDFSVLSMGMSADFELAIAEGSTLVRVGTAIFGERVQ
ncbi:MAG TPA: YggS family pyridoxal phosphate-dependent enzyme [Treponemataceae bacterium]|nr:YggS family pyridoxal phosphate-dependent enzyme [Treponemataceae bacterium]HPS44051.1 YggS family pyridoxal phosphate-dependent enzyme [Treponemataceae bacterium]